MNVSRKKQQRRYLPHYKKFAAHLLYHIARLQDGSMNSNRVEDTRRVGQPMTVTDDYNTEQVKKLLKDDRTSTCEEMAQELEISVGSVRFLLRNHLKMRKVSARWLPHCLTPEQAEHCLTVATQLLYRYDSERQDFLERIVAINETWIRSYEPEMRRQSTKWHTPSSPRPAKYRRTRLNLRC